MKDWIENIGVCPVPESFRVDVIYRDGSENLGVAAGEDADRAGGTSPSHWTAQDWSLIDDPRDIVLWRPHDPDIWIAWSGGDCPLPNGTMIDLRQRDGEEQEDEAVGEGWAQHDDPDYWSDDGCDGDIVAFKVVAGGYLWDDADIRRVDGVDMRSLDKVLAGDHKALRAAFMHNTTPQTDDDPIYWHNRAVGNAPLSGSDKAFLAALREHARGAKSETAKRIWSESDIPKVADVKVPYLELVLDGKAERLWEAFTWHSTPHDHEYWSGRASGRIRLSDDDRAFLTALLEHHRGGEKGQPSKTAPPSRKWTDEQLRMVESRYDFQYVRQYLSGEKPDVDKFFAWATTPQGSGYWRSRERDHSLINDEDRTFLRELIEYRDRLKAEPDAKPQGDATARKWTMEQAKKLAAKASIDALSRVLAGDVGHIISAFGWDNSPQGYEHWSVICKGLKPLSEDDTMFLRAVAEFTRQRLGLGDDTKKPEATRSLTWTDRDLDMVTIHDLEQLRQLADGKFTPKALAAAFSWMSAPRADLWVRVCHETDPFGADEKAFCRALYDRRASKALKEFGSGISPDDLRGLSR